MKKCYDVRRKIKNDTAKKEKSQAVQGDNFIKKMLDDVDRHTPKTGYNLVGIDDFEPFGEQLYTTGHYETYEAALAGQELQLQDRIYPHKREE